ncbi:adenine nucleotide alpha hydrolase family protein [Tenacibaculum ovolyticum]|uniref:hypothetical protein n=1 Tax=Tenacibaculum ovolyticum TaxID=104270 RepID=UPI00040FB7DE|nr:hypothetical protein [Tenacibaculum ovolyticum]
MKNNGYKILVLSNLNESTNEILKSSVSLAKIVGTNINFLYVKKPTEVVSNDNQLSAMRAINSEYIATGKRMKDIVNPISNKYNIAINHSFVIGNVKNEIEKYIEDNQPDIVILGKKKSKKANFMGDNITKFILKKHKGTIVIADDKNTLNPNEELSLGVLNNVKPINKLTKDIISSTKKPLTSIKTTKGNGTVEEEVFFKDKETIQYAFDKADNNLKDISNYLLKNNTNLLFVDRENIKSIKSNINDLIKNIDCSLILTT